VFFERVNPGPKARTAKKQEQGKRETMGFKPVTGRRLQRHEVNRFRTRVLTFNVP